MNEHDLILAILWWQTNPAFHPLTCGNDSHHPPLYFEDRLLKCHACDYTQMNIPMVVYRAWLNREQIDDMLS